MKAVIVAPSWERICGVPLVERTLRSLKQIGVSEVLLTGCQDRLMEEFEGLRVRYLSHRDEVDDDRIILLKGDHLFDPRIIEEICKETSPTLFLDEGPGQVSVAVDGDRVKAIGEPAQQTGDYKWIGIALVDGEAVASLADEGPEDIEVALGGLLERSGVHCKLVSDLESYVPKLRRDIAPYWLEIATARDRRKAEVRLIDSGQKDPSDLLARYLHNPIENWVVARLSNYPVTPNQVTFVVNVVAWAVTALFATGHLLVASLLTFAVGLIDGFDGKLARVKGMVTRVGGMEHAFDLLFEFSWIVALAYYLSLTHGTAPLILAAMTILLIAFYRNVYDRFGQSAGKSLDMYGRFERIFRRVAGRRNLFNVHILLFVLLGVPFYAIVSIFCHALVTALIYAYRALVHLHRLDRGSVGRGVSKPLQVEQGTGAALPDSVDEVGSED